MGVHGLWQLLQPAGRPVSLESLEGKVLAVDVSIWLHQTMKGMRDRDGNPLPNAHLQGLFSRVCKLLFYRIKPVFVFDGGVPVLKKKTLAARRDRREEAERESSAVAEKLLENLVKSHAVKEVLGAGGQRGGGLGSPAKSKPGRVPGVRKGRNQKLEDIFELAPLPESEEVNLIKAAQDWEQDFEQQENWIKEGLAALSDTHPDADEFKSLPAEIQHEILRELKERKKYHSLSHLTKMPEDSEDFSSYQLKRLMKNCRLTTRMEEIRKEMSNQTAIDITAQYTGEDCEKVKNQFGDQVEARRIVSEDSSHYVLIKGISSDGQMRQANQYHLEQAVKVEDVDSDSDTNSINTGKGKVSSPDKSRKSSVKIVSTDESDSDIETVVARRFKKKGKSKAWAAKRNTRGLDRGKITAALRVKDEKTKLKPRQKENPVMEISSSSEDEGFIEVTVDADGPMEEDELFPASIFERPCQSGDSDAKDIHTLIDGGKRSPKSKEMARRKQKQAVWEDGGKKDKAAPRFSETNVADSDMLGSCGINNTGLSERGTDPGKAKEGIETSAVKRKNVLSDILGQLKEKKKKLEEEVGSMVDLSPGEMSEDKFMGKFSPVNRSEVVSDQVEEEAGLVGGGFIPEDSSEEDASTGSNQTQNKTDGAGVSQRDTSEEDIVSHERICVKSGASSDSDSDEDLKLAKKLSMQADPSGKILQQRDSELDADLKLAIQLSLEASKPEENRARPKKSTEQTKEKEREVQKKISNLSKSSASEEDSDGFEDVAELELADSTEPSEEWRVHDEESVCSSTGQTRHEKDETDQSRLQPEDFEVDDSERTEYVPAMTELDLRDMREVLESERSALILQQGQRNRMATSVTEQINLDAQDLLRLFGIPFIVSPLEAEAQCAFLEAAGLTEGTITDDSDFWLFGGQRMYKNFFNQSKHVELYTMDNIHNHFSLSRDQLINIALLCGSDYTEGLQGVGPVRALEIMAEFPGTGLDGLYKFRQWWDKTKKAPGFMTVENKIRARLRNLTLIPGFPSEAVVEAYMNPTVDESTESFSWASPDLDLLRDFCKLKFGWAREKSNQTLIPMFREWSKTQSQGRISSYFGPEAFVQTSKIKSDRLRKALELVKNPSSEAPAEGKRATTEPSSTTKNGKAASVGKKKSKKQQTAGTVGKAEKTLTSQASEKISSSQNKRESKKVSFAEELEEDLDNVREKEFDNDDDDGEGHQEEQGDRDFMLKMSEKVKQAREDLDKMRQARNFACVAPRGGKTVANKGNKPNGKGRGGTGKTEGKRNQGNRIPISLDIPRRPGSSQRARSARGKAGHSKPTGAVNLSESSSSDENSSDESLKKIKLRKQAKRMDTLKTPEKAPKVKAISSVAKAREVDQKNEPAEGKGEAEGKLTVPVGIRADDRKLTKLQSTNTTVTDTGALSSKQCGLSGSDFQSKQAKVFEKLSTEKPEQVFIAETINVSSGSSTNAHEADNFGDSLREDEMSRIAVEKTSDKTEKKKVTRETKSAGGTITTTRTQKSESVQSPHEEDSVDMSKADVSVINRRNMPSTMAYLNQRSRQDKMLLHQISGKRLRNAVELRMEQEERRQPLPLERVKREEKEENEGSHEQEDPDEVMSGLSFEDALFGGDLGSTSSASGKKRKVSIARGKASTSRNAGGGKTSQQDLNEKRTNQAKNVSKILPNTKSSPPNLSNVPVDMKILSAAEASSKSQTEISKRPSSLNGAKRSKPVPDTVSSSPASGREPMEPVDMEPLFDLESQILAEQRERGAKKPKVKSNRSRAFDRPIMSADSFDDSSPSSQGRKFKNQLKHLHEPRSVKGHGPLYVLAPGQEMAARAFAGKGKGRGKNRTPGGASETGGGFVTAAERQQYETMTVEDLGSDFSDGEF